LIKLKVCLFFVVLKGLRGGTTTFDYGDGKQKAFSALKLSRLDINASVRLTLKMARIKKRAC
jgi:hypothetical protein